MMSTSFTLTFENVLFELTANMVSESDTIEVWRVSSRQDPNTFIELSNDRPLLHNKHQYTQRFKWTVLDGEPRYRRMATLITTYMDYYIKGLWKPPTKGVNDKKAAAAKQQGKLF